MDQKPTEVKCDTCATVFEADLRWARKGELHASYLQCPACYTVYPSSITDRQLRKLIQDFPTGMTRHKRSRAAMLKKQHGESLKQMDGWTEERAGGKR